MTNKGQYMQSCETNIICAGARLKCRLDEYPNELMLQIAIKNSTEDGLWTTALIFYNLIFNQIK